MRRERVKRRAVMRRERVKRRAGMRREQAAAGRCRGGGGVITQESRSGA